jgi:hypothetical protein
VYANQRSSSPTARSFTASIGSNGGLATTSSPEPATTVAPTVFAPVPSTTVPPMAPVRPATVNTTFSSPGPAGTTLSLITFEGTGDTAGDVCYQVAVSDPGAASFPGKPAFQPISRCLPAIDVHPINHPVGDQQGEIYRSHSGVTYMIAVGQAKDASSVTYRFADHRTASVKVVDGWYLTSMTYAQYSAGDTETSYGADG